MAEEDSVKLHPDIALPMINLGRVISLYYTAQYSKGLDELERTEAQTMAALKSKSNFVGVNFQQLKAALLFQNQKFRECWMALQESYAELNNDPDSGLGIFEMMIQLELGNFQLLPGMAKKVEKKLAQHKLLTQDYEAMLSFFKKADAGNYHQLALAALKQFKNHAPGDNVPRPDVFALIKYPEWLEATAGLKTKTGPVRGAKHIG